MARQVFEAVDLDRDGEIHEEEVRAALWQLNMEVGLHSVPTLNRRALTASVAQVPDQYVRKMITALDLDCSGSISWHEWRDKMMLAPTAHVQDVFRCVPAPFPSRRPANATSPCRVVWRSYWVTIADIGEVIVAPHAKTSDWWRHLVAGGARRANSALWVPPRDHRRPCLTPPRAPCLSWKQASQARFPAPALRPLIG